MNDPRTETEAFRLETIDCSAPEFEPARSNAFGVYWIESGAGDFWADAACHSFQADHLLFFVPYQHVRFSLRKPMVATAVRFHANFLCVETFHAETGCSGVLFNDPYGVPIVSLKSEAKPEIEQLFRLMLQEQAQRELAHEEALLSLTKLLLIRAARLKSASLPTDAVPRDFRHPVIASLRELVEQHYCTLHTPADYARLLHMTPKTLGRIVKEQLGKTLTDLIRERLLIHAKWQLLHTLRPVKEISQELGFQDQLYFSRLFKKSTGLSPTQFRDYETEIRGGSNLSMLSSHAPIPS